MNKDLIKVISIIVVGAIVVLLVPVLFSYFVGTSLFD